MEQFTLAERVRYAFDNTLSRGTGALIGWLALVSVVVVAAFGALLALTGIAPPDSPALSFGEAAWETLMRTLDAGTMGGDQGWAFRVVMLAVTLAGIFTISTLIGVLSSGLEGRLDELRKGRSRVVETGHTVILGWSEQVLPILAELAEANASRPGHVVVVVGDRDKVEMEDIIRDRLSEPKGLRVICRNGNPAELVDLRMASIDTARAILVLGPDAHPDPDIAVIKALLAITNNPNRRKNSYHIVAEIRKPNNLAAAQLIAPGEVELVLIGELIARITAQTCRQSGLSVVYTELLDFDGVEIYFHREPSLAGRTFGDVLLAYDTASVFGIRKAGAAPLLNPSRDAVLAADDELVVVAEDDAAIRLAQAPARPDSTRIALAPPVPSKPERALVLGWNWRGHSVVRELDTYVAAGSAVHVVAAGDSAARAGQGTYKNLTVTVADGDATDRSVLNGLGVDGYDHVIVLASADDLDAEQADARTLITLLHLRDIAKQTNTRLSIVSEMLELNNRKLAEVAQVDDFIVSDRLVSLLLAQIVENKGLNLVFQELFSTAGNEIYLKPLHEYAKTDQPLSFATLVAAASARGEIALGYRRVAQGRDAAQRYGVVINPAKSASVSFDAGDQLIVLAEG